MELEKNEIKQMKRPKPKKPKTEKKMDSKLESV